MSNDIKSAKKLIAIDKIKKQPFFTGSIRNYRLWDYYTRESVRLQEARLSARRLALEIEARVNAQGLDAINRGKYPDPVRSQHEKINEEY